MSEYKENTVGWQLSQLKEPLKSRALASMNHRNPSSLDLLCEGFANALSRVKIANSDPFWVGAFWFFNSSLDSMSGFSKEEQNGWDMAKKCAPDNWLKPKDGGEDKAIVDSPKKTTELFFYASDETLINPLQNPFKEPLTISPSGEMLSVIVEEDKIKELMNANPGVTFWPTNVGGVSPEKPESWVGGEIRKYREHLLNGGVEYADTERGKVKLVTDSPAREIEAPERAVVGYEEPKPIDTIEKKHELRIKNLEGQVKYLEDMVGSLSRSLEIISKRVLKTDDHGTR